jgi:hypothetical protein
MVQHLAKGLDAGRQVTVIWNFVLAVPTHFVGPMLAYIPDQQDTSSMNVLIGERGG